MYASYPTGAFQESDKLSIVASSDMIKLLFKHEINVFGLDVTIAPDAVMQLIGYVSKNGPVSVNEVFTQFSMLDRPQMWRTIAWLVKMGVFGRKAA